MSFLLCYDWFYGWYFYFLDGGFGCSFYVSDLSLIFLGHERECYTLFPSSSCPTDPMCICFCIMWYIIIYYMSKIIYVDTSSSNIRSTQQGDFLTFEFFEHFFSLTLSHIAMQCISTISYGLYLLHEFVASSLRLAKHDSIYIRSRINHSRQRLQFITLA